MRDIVKRNFHLPCADCLDSEKQETSPRDPLEKGIETILIVEDNEQILEFQNRCLAFRFPLVQQFTAGRFFSMGWGASVLPIII
jgi:hypothetical protein